MVYGESKPKDYTDEDFENYKNMIRPVFCMKTMILIVVALKRTEVKMEKDFTPYLE